MIKYTSMKKFLSIFSLIIPVLSLKAQNGLADNYTAYLVRQDKNTVVFNIEVVKENNQTVFYIINADEKIKVSPIEIKGDSIKFSMPIKCGWRFAWNLDQRNCWRFSELAILCNTKPGIQVCKKPGKRKV
jgi:hypothetical protein